MNTTLSASRPELADLGGTWCDDGACWRGVAWGDATWFDPVSGKLLRQELDFFPVDRTWGPAPLVLYLHPPLDSRAIHPANSPLYFGLVRAARACGMAVASMDYRHPAPHDPGDPPLDNDVTWARRWIHAHAEPLGIDPRNVFLVDQSPGMLGQWTAHHHRRDPTVRVGAAYSHHGRTGHQGPEVARRFVVEGHWLAFVDPVPPERAYDGVLTFFQRHLR